VSFLQPKPLAVPQPGRIWLAAAAIFAAGAVLGAVVAPSFRSPAIEPAARRSPAPSPLALSYPAELVRVIDGDTFEARVRVWPGVEAVTRVRLRSVDAPEMKARCEAERVKAVAARDALARMLAARGVGISNVTQDKYGGRVDADVLAAGTGDVGEALVQLGLARRYDGGRRAGWCG
jgi:endonuclease YncB( thermonuclease family)